MTEVIQLTKAEAIARHFNMSHFPQQEEAGKDGLTELTGYLDAMNFMAPYNLPGCYAEDAEELVANKMGCPPETVANHYYSVSAAWQVGEQILFYCDRINKLVVR